MNTKEQQETPNNYMDNSSSRTNLELTIINNQRNIIHNENGRIHGSSGEMAPPKNITTRVILDIVCCVIVAIPLLVLELGNIQPYRRGYFCDDDSIRLDYKDSTIPSWLAYLVGTTVPFFVFLATESMRYKLGRLEPIYVKCFGFRVHPLLYAMYTTIFFFGFGCLCSQIFTDIGKYAVGRLRPHFLAVCQSNYVCPTPDNHFYIVDYTCDGIIDKIKDARLSFPSGHSSFSFYTMVYLVLYLQFRFKWRKSPLLRPFLQLCALILAYYTALSRISDHKHHYSDVLAGSLLGTIVALFTCFAFSDLYQKTPSKAVADITLPLTMRQRESP